MIPTKLSNLNFFIVSRSSVSVPGACDHYKQLVFRYLPKSRKSGEGCGISNVQIIVQSQLEFSLSHKAWPPPAIFMFHRELQNYGREMFPSVPRLIHRDFAKFASDQNDPHLSRGDPGCRTEGRELSGLHYEGKLLTGKMV